VYVYGLVAQVCRGAGVVGKGGTRGQRHGQEGVVVLQQYWGEGGRGVAQAICVCMYMTGSGGVAMTVQLHWATWGPDQSCLESSWVCACMGTCRAITSSVGTRQGPASCVLGAAGCVTDPDPARCHFLCCCQFVQIWLFQPAPLGATGCHRVTLAISQAVHCWDRGKPSWGFTLLGNRLSRPCCARYPSQCVQSLFVHHRGHGAGAAAGRRRACSSTRR
jgi:hypothetical protein